MKERSLYLALVLVYLVPVWAVEYFPTTDGPAHMYNAWALLHHGDPAGHPWLDRYYEIDARPLPNWLGHAVMAGLMTAVPPRIAEKLLVSGCILLFLFGARFLVASVDPERGWMALLAFPLAYSQLFQTGFYNFCLGLALLLFTVGVWWRQRDAPGLGLALRLNALLLLIWFSHLVAFLLTAAALGTLWLITWRREGGGFRGRRHLLHPAILAPQAALPLWYLTTLEGDAAMRWLPRKAVVLVQYLFQMGQVFSLHHGALRIGTVLSAVFLVFLALTVRGRLRGERRAWREEDAFLLAALLFAALYFVVPDGGVGGTQLKNRFALVPPLLLLPWLAPELGRRGRTVAIAGLAVLALAHAGFLLRWYRDADREIRTLVAGAADIAPGSRVLPLLFERRLPGWGGVLRHAFAHAAVEKELFDWSNYQAVTPHFPIRFRAGVQPPSLWIIQNRPGELDVRPYRDEIDYIYCWKLRPRSKIARRIEEDYVLVAERGPTRVYARRED